jgi:N-acetylglucosaminyl-diphospho-decaprenol L-rhamnosyltransferase
MAERPLTPPPVTVAVVSFNTRDLLARCLRSLEPEANAGRANVWVVDNESSDGSPDLVRNEFPWVELVEPDENLGFGRAVNLVARESDADWIVAANADIACEPGALETLLAAGADPRVGVVAPRLILPDGSTQHSVYHFPTVPFTLAFNLGLPQRSRRLGDRLLLHGYWDAERPREVDWAIGALLLIRRTAFDAVGGFDEQQWMYAEDLDIGWRLRQAGWTTHYEPRARVLHEESAAASPAFGGQKTARFMAATYAALLRRRGLARTWTIAALNVAGAAARLAWLAPLARVWPRWAAPRDMVRVWLGAHRQGLRRPRTLLRPDGARPRTES